MSGVACSRYRGLRSRKKVRGRPPEETLRLRHRRMRRSLEAFFKMDRLVGSSAYQRSAQCASLHPAAQAAPASVLTDAALDLDNNATERVFAALLGRKNHHGARSERGTQRGSATVQPDRFGAVADLEPLGALSAPLAQVEERPGSPRSCRWAEEHRAHVVRSRASGSRARAHGARAHGARAVRERSSTAHEVRERPSELTRSVNAHRGSRGP